jgi:hypothetical protein
MTRLASPSLPRPRQQFSALGPFLAQFKSPIILLLAASASLAALLDEPAGAVIFYARVSD